MFFYLDFNRVKFVKILVRRWILIFMKVMCLVCKCFVRFCWIFFFVFWDDCVILLYDYSKLVFIYCNIYSYVEMFFFIGFKWLNEGVRELLSCFSNS